MSNLDLGAAQVRFMTTLTLRSLAESAVARQFLFLFVFVASFFCFASRLLLCAWLGAVQVRNCAQLLLLLLQLML